MERPPAAGGPAGGAGPVGARVPSDPPADRSTTLVTAQAVWESQARADPLWAVLSDPDRAGRRWDLPAFMASGEAMVSGALARYRALGGEWVDREVAVDFGCGVGRLTQPLARQFRRVIGVDISPTMVAVADRLNQFGDRVEYRANDRPDLSFLADGSVSLVFTHITLQHVPAGVAVDYLLEFLRGAKPGGAVIFQLPSHLAESYLHPERDDAPVPEAARAAAIVIGPAPAQVEAGTDLELTVDVTNVSDRIWYQSGDHSLNVGNHWCVVDTGVRTVTDDGRGRLPSRFRPAETARVAVRVHAPDEPGHYRLEFDVVQETVAWFEGSGSSVGSVELDVVPAGAPEPPADGSASEAPAFGDLIADDYFEAPVFEMNPVPRHQVEALLRDAGATLLGTEEFVDNWHSYTYFVRTAD